MRIIFERLLSYDAFLLIFTAWPAVEACVRAYHVHKARRTHKRKGRKAITNRRGAP